MRDTRIHNNSLPDSSLGSLLREFLQLYCLLQSVHQLLCRQRRHHEQHDRLQDGPQDGPRKGLQDGECCSLLCCECSEIIADTDCLPGDDGAVLDDGHTHDKDQL